MPPSNNLPQTTSGASGLDPTVLNLAKAIRDKESGGNFNARGASGEYGAYQFTAPTWASVAPKYGIKSSFDTATPQEQNAVAYNYIVDLKKQGYNPMQIASIWNSGKPDPTGNVGVNSLGVRYDTEAYVQDVYSRYQKYKGGAPAPQQQGADQSDTFSALFKDLATNAINQPKETAIGALEGAISGGYQSFVNLPSSAAANILGIADLAYSLATDPTNTLYTFGQGAYGGLEYLAGVQGETASKNVANQFGQALYERYGTPGNLQRTAAVDPLGLGADVLSVGAGGASLAGAGGRALRGVSSLASPVAEPLRTATRAVTNPVADYIMAPLRNMADTEAIQAARRSGIELPAGAMTTSPTIRLIENVAQTGLGAEKYAARVTSAIEQLETKAADIVKSTGGIDDLADAGKAISDGLADFNKNFRATSEKFYTALQTKYGDVAAITSKAVQAIDEIIANKKAIGDLEGIKFFETKRKVLTGGKGFTQPTLTTLRKVKTDLGEKIDSAFGDPFTTQNKNQLKRMYASIESSIGDTIRSTGDDGAMALYLKANKYYADGIKEITSTFGKTIRRLQKNGQYDKIANTLVKPSTSIEDIPRILALVGEDGAKSIRSTVVQEIIKDARNAEGEFRPLGVQNAMKRWKTADGKSKLDALLTPEQQQGLEDIGKLSKVLADAQKIAKGSQTAYILKNLSQGGALYAALGALMTGNILGFMSLVAAAGLPEFASYFLSSNTGQRLLRLGVEKGQSVRNMAQRIGVWEASWNSGLLGLTATTNPSNMVLNEYNPVSNNPLSNGGSDVANNGAANNMAPSSTGVLGNGGDSRGNDRGLPGVPTDTGNNFSGGNARLEAAAKEKRFDINAARKAGYTDDEIADFLGVPKDGPTSQSGVGAVLAGAETARQAVGDFLRPTQKTAAIEAERGQSLMPSEVARIKNEQATGLVPMTQDEMAYYKDKEQFFDPLGAVGSVKRVGGKVASKILADDLRALTAYIDNVRIGKEAPEWLLKEAETVLEKLGGNMNGSMQKLANMAEDIISGKIDIGRLYNKGKFKGEK